MYQAAAPTCLGCTQKIGSHRMDRFADGIFGPFIQELGILTQFACLLRRYEKGRLKTLYIGFQTTFAVS